MSADCDEANLESDGSGHHGLWPGVTMSRDIGWHLWHNPGMPQSRGPMSVGQQVSIPLSSEQSGHRVVSGVKSYFSISQPRWAGGHGAGMIIIMDLNRYTSTTVMYSWMVTTMAKIHNGYHTFIKFSSWSLPWLRHCVQLLRLILQQRCKPRIPATLAACAASPLLSPETNLPIQISMLGPTIALMEPLIILSLHHEHLPRVTPTNQPEPELKLQNPSRFAAAAIELRESC